MKKSGIIFGMMVGMGASALFYNYTQKHPMEIECAKRKVEDLIKDLK